MKNPSRNTELGISDTRVAAVLLFVVLNLAVALLRLVSVLRYGELSSFDSALAIYPVWKGVHHLRIYEWPLAYPYSLALYNYLFYGTYAFVLRLIGVSGAGMMTWGRMITPAFVLVGAIAQWKLVQGHLKLSGARSALSLIFAIGLWFCASIVRHWSLSIRPDMAAVSLAMIALLLVVRRPRFGIASAALFFYLAWSFKETAILTFVAVCLFLASQRRWKDLTLLASIFCSLVALTLLLGSPEYRYNILVAPGVVKEFSLAWAAQIAPKSLLANASWILAPITIASVAGVRKIDDTSRILIAVLIVGLIGGLAGMTKTGAWDNYLLEAFVAGSTLLQMAIFTAPGRFATALVAFGCVQPAIQLAMPQSGRQVHTLGTVGIATPAEYSDAVAMRERLSHLKKPIFTTDPLFSLPWFSTDNSYPALVIDPVFHDATRAICQNGCAEAMLQKGEIPTVMLLSSGDSYTSDLNPRYRKVSEAMESDRPWSIYVLDPEPPRSDRQSGK